MSCLQLKPEFVSFNQVRFVQLFHGVVYNIPNIPQVRVFRFLVLHLSSSRIYLFGRSTLNFHKPRGTSVYCTKLHESFLLWQGNFRNRKISTKIFIKKFLLVVSFSHCSSYLSVIRSGFVVGAVQEMQFVKESLQIFRSKRIAINCVLQLFEGVVIVISAFV